MDAFVLGPIAVGRPWGAGPQADPGWPVGEWWLCSDYPSAQTCVVYGPASGLNIQAIIAVYGSNFWGNARPRERFPILAKQLRPRYAVPLQVHSADGIDCKNECWYVQTTHSSGWIINRWTGDDRQVARSIQNFEIFRHLVRDFVTPGMLITVPAGCIHALGPEVVVLEIQDTADLTLRISLWGHSEWNLPLDKTRAAEEFSRKKNRGRILQGRHRGWDQENWTVRVETCRRLRLKPLVPTVVVNGQQDSWIMRQGTETVLGQGLQAALVLPGSLLTLESLQGDSEWVVSEVR